MASKFEGREGSTQWALFELGLLGDPEPPVAEEKPSASPSGAKTVNPRTLPRLRIHPSVSREDRIKVYELLLRGLFIEAQSLADDLERRNTAKLRVRDRDTRHTLAVKRRLGFLIHNGTPEQQRIARMKLAQMDKQRRAREQTRDELDQQRARRNRSQNPKKAA